MPIAKVIENAFSLTVTSVTGVASIARDEQIIHLKPGDVLLVNDVLDVSKGGITVKTQEGSDFVVAQGPAFIINAEIYEGLSKGIPLVYQLIELQQSQVLDKYNNANLYYLTLLLLAFLMPTVGVMTYDKIVDLTSSNNDHKGAFDLSNINFTTLIHAVNAVTDHTNLSHIFAATSAIAHSDITTAAVIASAAPSSASLTGSGLTSGNQAPPTSSNTGTSNTTTTTSSTSSSDTTTPPGTTTSSAPPGTGTVAPAIATTPSSHNETITTAENSPGTTLKLTDFITPQTGTNAASTFNIVMDTVPTHGVLALNGVAVTAGQVITSAEIANNELTFTPNHDSSGSDAITFQVISSAGVTNPGGPNTLEMNITPSGDIIGGDIAPPVLVQNDPLNTGRVLFGLLTNATASGDAVDKGVSFLAETIKGQEGTFTLQSDGNYSYTLTSTLVDGQSYTDVFTVETPNGSMQTVTISLLGNDAPAGANEAVTIGENSSYTLHAGDFGYSGLDGNSLTQIMITTLPTAGTLTLNGNLVTVGEAITVAELAANELVFTPAQNTFGTGYASFGFEVQDNGIANTGINTAESSNVITFNVTGGNDVITGPGVNSAALLVQDDPAGTNSISGQLTNASAATNPVDNGVSFVAETNATGTGNYGELTLAANGAYTYTLNTGVNLNPGQAYTDTFTVQTPDGTTQTLTINLLGNDAPTAANTSITIGENAAHIFTVADFGYSPAMGTADVLQDILIKTLPTNGTLTLNGAAVTVNETITPMELAAGQLVFTPTQNTAGNAYANFTFEVQDNGQVTGGGINTSETPNTITFNVTASHDTITGPGATTAALLVQDDPAGTNSISGQLTNASAATNPVDNHISFVSEMNATGTGNYGQLTLDTNGAYTYTLNTSTHLNPGQAETDSFTIQTPDGTTQTLTINLLGNDTPTAASNLTNVTLTGSHIFTAADFGYTGADSSNALTDVLFTSVPTNGSLIDTATNTVITDGMKVSAADINAGDLVFNQPAGNATVNAYAFNFEVQDNGQVTTGDTQPNTSAPATFTIDDAPIGSNSSFVVETQSGSPATTTLTLADIGYQGLNGASLQQILITQITPGFTFELDVNGTITTLKVGDYVTAPEIANGDFLLVTPFTVLTPDSSTSAILGYEVQDNSPTNTGQSGLNTALTINTISPYFSNITGPGVSQSPDTLVENNPTNSITFSLKDFNAGSDTNNQFIAETNVAVTDGTVTLTDNGVLTYTLNPSVTLNYGQVTPITFNVQTPFGVTQAVTLNLTGDDAPTANNKTVALGENAPYALSAGDFGYTPANAAYHLTGVEITSLPINGTLTLNGNAVTVGEVISLMDLNNHELIYTPGLNSTLSGSFGFEVQDNAPVTTGSGATSTSASPNTISFNITASNDVITGTGVSTSALLVQNDPTGSESLTGQLTNASTNPIDTTPFVAETTNGQHGTFSITNTGAWTYSLTSTLIDGQSYTETFTVLTPDGTAQTVTVNLLGNDAPSGHNETVTLGENASYVLHASDFGYSGFDGDALTQVIITTLPTNGTLTLNGVAVTAQEAISIAQLAANDLVFTPTLNSTSSASFGFEVQDNGQTTDGSANIAQTTNTITFNITASHDVITGTGVSTSALLVQNDPTGSESLTGQLTNASTNPIDTTPFVANTTNGQHGTFSITNTGAWTYSLTSTLIDGQSYTETFTVLTPDGTAQTVTVNLLGNDAPSGHNETVTLGENASYVLHASDFGYSGFDGDALTQVIITTLPTNGTLTLNGVAVTAQEAISIAQLAANDLVFTPTLNSTSSASFGFEVQDNGQTTDGSANIAQTTNTITFNITASHDVITGTGVSSSALLVQNDPTGSESLTGQLTNASTNPIDTTPFVAETTNGQHGTFSITNTGAWTYSLTSTLIDGQSYTETFTVLTPDGTAQTVTVNLLGNDAPSGHNETVTLGENASYVLHASDFGYSGFDGDALTQVIITTLPTNGTLTLNGVAVTAQEAISIAQLAANDLVFTPTLNSTSSASFGFEVQDNGQTTDGSANIAQTTNTITFNITASHDVITGTGVSTSALLVQNDPTGSESLTGQLTNASTNPIDTTPFVAETTNGQHGTFSITNTGAWTYSLTSTLIDGQSYTETFTVLTPDGTAQVVTVNLLGNDAPSGHNETVTLGENASYVLHASDFGYSGFDGDALTQVIITTLPTNGTLTLNGVAVTAQEAISIAQLAANDLVFTPTLNSTSSASFGFEVQDNGQTTDGSANIAQTTNTITFNITASHDVITGTGVSTSALLVQNDPTGSESLTGQLTNASTNPIDTTPFVANTMNGQHGTFSITNTGAWTYSLTSTLIDGQSYTETFTVLTPDGTAQVVTVNLLGDDAPSGHNEAVAVGENASYTLHASDFGYSGFDGDALTQIIITTLPTNGTLTLNGVAVTASEAITIAQLAANDLVFTPTLNSTSSAQFSFEVQDNGQTTDGSANIAQAANTITFNITASHDVITGPGVSSTAVLVQNNPSGSESLTEQLFNSSTNPIDTTPFVAESNVAGTYGNFSLTSAGVWTYNLTSALTPGQNYTDVFNVLTPDGTMQAVTVHLAGNDTPTAVSQLINIPLTTTYIFTDASFGYSGVNNSFQDVLFTSVPTNGTLIDLHTNTIITAGMTVSALDINSNGTGLVFEQPTNNSTVNSYTFGFEVQDGGLVTTGDSQANTSAPATLTLNDAPIGSNIDFIVTTQPGSPTTSTITLAQIGYQGLNGASLQDIIITQIRSGSTYELDVNGTITTLGVGSVVTAQEIANGDFLFVVPSATFTNGTAYGNTLSYEVQDNSPTNTGQSGLNTALATNTISQFLYYILGPGVGESPDTLVQNNPSSNTITFSIENWNQSREGSPNAQFVVENNVAVTDGTVSITDNGIITYTLNAGVTLAYGQVTPITFNVQTGEAAGLSITQAVTLDLANDAPTAQNETVILGENAPYTLHAADFGYAPASASYSLTGILITSLPTSGTLTLNGSAVTVGEVISPAQLSGNQLVYTPAHNSTSSGSFGFEVEDNAPVTTGSGATSTSTSPNTITFNITAGSDVITGSGVNSTALLVQNDPTGSESLTGQLTNASTNPIDTTPFVANTTNGQHGTFSITNTGAWTYNLTSTLIDGQSYTETFTVLTPDGTAQVVTVNLLGDDAPSGHNEAVAVGENASYTLHASDFGYSGFDGDALTQIIITTLPTNGTLTLNGVAVTASEAITIAQLAANDLVFTPTLNSTSSAQFSFEVQDNGQTTDGSANIAQAANTITFNITASHDVITGPGVSSTAVLVQNNPSGSESLTEQLFNSSTNPIDTTPFVAESNVAGTYGNFSLTSAGVWTYNLTSALTPGQNYTDVFNVLTPDGTMQAVTVHLAGNDTPTAVSQLINIPLTTTYIFTDASFGYSGVNNSFQDVLFTSVPTNGTLIDLHTNTIITAGMTVSALDINSNGTGLVFEQPTNNSTVNSYTFGFEVQDGGLVTTGDSQANTSAPATLTLNDAPIGSNIDFIVTTQPGSPTTSTITLAQIGYQGLNGASLQDIIITQIRSGSTYELDVNGTITTLGVGSVVTAQEIANGDFLFVVPSATFTNGTAYGNTLSYEVQDNSPTNTGQSGLNTALTTNTISQFLYYILGPGVGESPDTLVQNNPSSNTITFSIENWNQSREGSPNAQFVVENNVAVTDGTVSITDNGIITYTLNAGVTLAYGQVTPITFNVQTGEAAGLSITQAVTLDLANDAPTAQNETVTLGENAPYTLHAADFGYAPANASYSLTGILITSLPTTGTLTLNGAAVTVGEVISPSQLSGNQLVYTPAHNSTSSGSFGFEVEDNAPVTTGSGATSTSTSPNTITFNITASHDTITGSGATTAALLVQNDPVGTESITGQLTNASAASNPVDNGVSFVAESNVAGTYGTFSLTAAGAWTYNLTASLTPGQSYTDTFNVLTPDGTAQTVTVNLLGNDAPSGHNETVTLGENAPYTLHASDFGYSGLDGDALTQVIITTLPTNGTLTLNGVAVTANEAITIAQLAANDLVFTPALNSTSSASFGFEVQDNGQTTNGSANISQASNTITFNITASHDTITGPGATTAALLVQNDPVGTESITGQLTNASAASNPVDNGVSFVAESNVAGTYGTFSLTAAGAWTYNLTASLTPGQSYTDTFNVLTPDGTAQTVTVNLLGNDAPSGHNEAVAVGENSSYTLHASDFGYSGLDGDALTQVIITTLPTNGTLTLNGVAVTANEAITIAQLAANDLVFTPALNSTSSASFGFEVQDNGQTTNGSANISQTTNTITFNITASHDTITGSGVNSTALLVQNDPTGSESLTGQLTNASTNPIDTTPFVAESNVAGTYGNFSLTSAGAWTYNLTSSLTPGQNYTDAFNVLTPDGTIQTVTVHLAGNDIPSVASNLTNVTLTGTHTFTAADFGYSGVGGDTLSDVLFTSVPSSGTLVDTRTGITITNGMTVSAADINAGDLVFNQPAGNATFNTYNIGFEVQDNGQVTTGDAQLNTSAPATFTIDDAPIGTNSNIIIQTQPGAASTVFTLAELGYQGLNGASLQQIVITPANAAFHLELDVNGTITNLGAGSIVTAQQIAAGDFILANPSLVDVTAEYDAIFSFYVQDNSPTNTGQSGLNTSLAPNTLSAFLSDIEGPGINTSPDTLVQNNPSNSITFDIINRSAEVQGNSNAQFVVENNVAVTDGTVSLSATGVLTYTLNSGVTLNFGQTTPITFNVVTPFGVTQAVTLDLTGDDAPTAKNETVSLGENTPYTLHAADFGYTPANAAFSLTGILITSLPTAGTLTLNGAAVTVGEVITPVELSGNQLVYTPVHNSTSSGSFGFEVEDNAPVTTGSGATSTSASPNTITFNITASHDFITGPGVSSTAVLVQNNPSGSESLTEQLFNFSTNPIDTTPFVAESNVAGTYGNFSLTSAGVWTYNLTSALTPGQNYTDVFNVLTPDGTTQAVTVHLAGNDTITAVSQLINIPLTSTYIFGDASFGYSGVSGTFHDILFTSVPTNGTLIDLHTNTVITAGMMVSTADLRSDGTGLVFEQPTNNSTVNSYTFGFELQDGGLVTTGDSQANTSAPATLTLDDAPIGANSVFVSETQSGAPSTSTITLAQLGYQGLNGASLQDILITQITAGITLETDVNGTITTLAAGSVVSTQNIANGDLLYVTRFDLLSTSASGQPIFSFEVQDNSPTNTGQSGLNTALAANTVSAYLSFITGPGVDSSPDTLVQNNPSSNTITFSLINHDQTGNSMPNAQFIAESNVAVTDGTVTLTDNGILTYTLNTGVTLAYGQVTPITFNVQTPLGVTQAVTLDLANDAPTANNETVTLGGHLPYTLHAADFGYTPANASYSLTGIKITALPTSGTLTLNGAAVTVGEVISTSQLSSNLLVYTPSTSSTSFGFEVQDNAPVTTGSGATSTSTTANTITFNITPDTITGSGVSSTDLLVQNDPSGSILTGQLTNASASTNPVDTTAFVAESATGTYGTFSLTSAGAWTYHLTATLAAGQTHTDTFSVLTPDGTAQTVTVNLEGNDTPTVASHLTNIVLGTSHTFTVADFGYVGVGSNTLSDVLFNSVPSSGTLTDTHTNTVITAGMKVSAADISAGDLVFSETPGNTTVSSYAFNFEAQDNGQVTTGDAQLNTSAAATFTIDDAPIGSNSTFVVETQPNSATTSTITLAEIGYQGLSGASLQDIVISQITAGYTFELDVNGTITTLAAGSIVTAPEIANGDFLLVTPLGTVSPSGSPSPILGYQVQDNSPTNTGQSGLNTALTFNAISPYFSYILGPGVGESPDNLVQTTSNNSITFSLTNFNVDTGSTSQFIAENNVAVTDGTVSLTDTGTLTYTLNAGVTLAFGQTTAITFNVDTPFGVIQPVTLDLTGGIVTPPIVLNFSSDPTTYLSLSQSNVNFYNAAAGSEQHYTWASNTEGVLIYDPTHSGTITSTTQFDLTQDVANTSTDLQALQVLAGGGLQLTASNPIFNSLAVWIDANGNGVVDAGEMKTLSQLGITAINLTTNDVYSQTGDVVSYGVGSFVYDNGQIGTLVNAGFLTENISAPADTISGNTTALLVQSSNSIDNVVTGQLMNASADLNNGDNGVSFLAQANVQGQYGIFSLQANGTWTYTLTANLIPGQSYTDSFTALTPDNSSQVITVQLLGNETPTASNETVAISARSNYVLHASDFGYQGVGSNVLQGIIVQSLPVSGFLTLSGVAVTVGEVITAAQLSANDLVYTPGHNSSSTASFNFKVEDNAPVTSGSGATSTSSAANTITFNINTHSATAAASYQADALNHHAGFLAQNVPIHLHQGQLSLPESSNVVKSPTHSHNHPITLDSVLSHSSGHNSLNYLFSTAHNNTDTTVHHHHIAASTSIHNMVYSYAPSAHWVIPPVTGETLVQHAHHEVHHAHHH